MSVMSAEKNPQSCSNVDMDAENVDMDAEMAEGFWKVYWTINRGQSSSNGLKSRSFSTGLDHEWFLELMPLSWGTSNSILLKPVASHSGVKGYFKCTLSVLEADNVIKKMKSFMFDKDSPGNGLRYPLPSDMLVRDKTTIICEIITHESAHTSYNTLNDFESFSQDFGRLFNCEDFSDFKVQVGDRSFNLHKMVLSARSPVFAKMFKHPMKENVTNYLEITEGNADAMEEIFLYMYTGKCLKIKDMPLEILAHSHMYELHHLKSLAEHTLISEMNVNNVCDILIAADLYTCSCLKSFAILYLNTLGKEVMATDGWKKIANRPDLIHECYKCSLVFNNNLEVL